MTRVVLAANNAEVGGGEVMLLASAVAVRDLGVDVGVVGPSVDGGVLDEAEALGLPVLRRFPDARRAYVTALRRWDRERGDWLWCHGLVPALATTGQRRRIVHLHQAPSGRHRAAIAVARRGARAVLVPSHAMTRAVPGARVLWNWTGPVTPRTTGETAEPGPPVRVGFIGRHSADKGLDVLARAVADLETADPGRHRLVLAGDGRFVPAEQTARVDAALATVEHLVDRLGWCGRDEFFGSVDVAVFPSTWAEPFGLVAAEAMSAGVPVVVSDAGALPEVVGAGHPWVVPAGDAAALADTVRACLAAAPADRGRVVSDARSRWEEHFSPAAGRARVSALFGHLAIVPVKRTDSGRSR